MFMLRVIIILLFFFLSFCFFFFCFFFFVFFFLHDKFLTQVLRRFNTYSPFDILRKVVFIPALYTKETDLQTVAMI